MQLDSQALPPTPRKAHRFRRDFLALAILVLIAYLLAAYFVVPIAWRRYIRRHPALENLPAMTHTSNGIPGDPLNVALVGTEDDLKKALLAAHWYPADPITLRSSLGIAAGTLLRRPYEHAPVSNLYLFGRKQDLAFEQPSGGDPRKRHHVRFWRSRAVDDAGHPLWAGAATFDEHVGFSHETGQITHHIAPDVDAERDYLFRTLEENGGLYDVFWVDDFHQVREGRNGGGDPWSTDGRLCVGVVQGS